MSEPILTTSSDQTTRQEVPEQTQGHDRPAWETPQMQDVSEEVMAQPYIRFT